MKERDRSLDIAKGICMICMITVHLFNWWGNAWPKFNQYTGVFFLVFFFFASGLCFRPVPWKNYVTKRVRRLLVPYLVYCLVYAAYLWLVRDFFQGMGLLRRLAVIGVNTMEALPVGMTQVDFFHLDTYGVGPIWFVPCMFMANLFYRAVCRFRYRLPLCMAAALAATVSQRYFLLPFTIQNALIGAMFIAFGDCGRGLYEKLRVLFSGRSYGRQLALFAGVAAVYVFLIEKLPYQWMNLGGNLYFMRSLPSSLLGFCLVLMISFWIEKTAVVDEFFEGYGKWSMFILILHSADILMIRNWNNVGWHFIAVTLMGYLFAAYFKNRLSAALRRLRPAG